MKHLQSPSPLFCLILSHFVSKNWHCQCVLSSRNRESLPPRISTWNHAVVPMIRSPDDPISRSQVAALLRRATALDFSHIYPVFCHPKGWRREKNQFKNSIPSNTPLAI